MSVDDSLFSMEQAWEILYGDSSNTSETPTLGEYWSSFYGIVVDIIAD